MKNTNDSRHLALDDMWEKNFQLLKKHFEEYGPVWFKSNYPTPLAVWVKNQRQKKHTMQNYRRNRLNEISFPWRAPEKKKTTYQDEIVKLNNVIIEKDKEMSRLKNIIKGLEQQLKFVLNAKDNDSKSFKIAINPLVS